MPASKRSLPLLLLVAMACTLLAGCDDPNPTGTKPKDGAAAEATGLRIVSLSPALTQMIIDMGHRSALVGVEDSHGMVFDKLGLPTVGTYANVRTELILGLRPTHVVAMVGAEGPPQALAKLADTGGFKLVTFPYPSSVRDVQTIIMGNIGPGGNRLTSENSLAHLLKNDHGVIVALAMSTQLGRVGELADSVAKPGQKPKVLLVFGIDPRIQAAGPNTVLDDLLTNFCGGYNAAIPELKPLTPEQLNAIADPEKRRAAILAAAQDPALTVGTAPTFDREKLLEHKPDVILVFMPGEPPIENLETDPRFLDLRGLDIPAIKNKRIVLINDKTALVPGTGLPRVAAQMAKAIHPSLTERIDAILAGEPKEPTEQKEPKEPETKKPDENATPKKDDETKSDDKKVDEKKSEEKKPDEKAVDPAKTDPAKTDPAKTEK